MSQKQATLENMHKLFLEALRHREQEIFHYLAILGPALGGFVWLLHVGGPSDGVFVVGTASAFLLLLLGAAYSLALGYNYRYITLQLAKLEAMVRITHYMLEGWPRLRRQFLARYRLSRSTPRCMRRWVFGSLQRRSAYRRWLYAPWCTPPEIIKVFWWAFLAAMGGVALAACIYRPHCIVLSIVIPLGLACLAVGGCFFPWHYGKKFRKQCRQEPKSWPPEAPNAPEAIVVQPVGGQKE